MQDIPTGSERSNDALRKMKKNQLKYNERYAKWYMKMFEEFDYKLYKNKAENINACFKFQAWDVYEKNKILDNKAHFRCRNRFCVNCQILINSYHAWKLKPVLREYESEGYKPYFLTLTVPNCKFGDLRETIKKMNKTYYKLFQKFNADDRRKYSGRLMKIYGSIKVLEISVNHEKQEFHPHFHVLVLLQPDEDDLENLENNIRGRYSHNKGCYNMHSDFSIQIMKLWSMLWFGKSCRMDNIDCWPDDPEFKLLNEDGSIYLTNLEVNLQPFVSKVSENGVELDNNSAFAELLKYTVEFDQINSYEIFKYLDTQLKGLRRIQGSGILTGILKDITEDDPETDGDVQDLILTIKEDPKFATTQDLQQLYTTYEAFKKLYRKNTSFDKSMYNTLANKLDS